MNHTDMAQQILVENTMLKHLIDGLRDTLSWKAQGDFSRKLSTLRFIGQSFQRHFERLTGLEEFDGYMNMVMETCPHLGKHVEASQQEHNQIRALIRRILQKTERMPTTDERGFNQVCSDFEGLLQKVEDHHKKESNLWQEAFKRDGGGEG